MISYRTTSRYVALTALSATFAGVADAQADGAGTRLTAIAVAPTIVSLEWTATEGTTAYRVFRRLGMSSGWCVVAATDSDSTTYQDPTVSGSTTYIYYVEPLPGSRKPDVTAVALVTTPPQPGFVFQPSHSPVRRTTALVPPPSALCDEREHDSTGVGIIGGAERLPSSAVLPQWLGELEDHLDQIAPLTTAHPVMR